MEKSKRKKKPNYFRIHSEKLNKAFWWLFAITIIFDGTLLLALFVDFICECISGKGHGASRTFMGYDFFVEFVFIVMIFSFMGFAIVVLYNYAINKDKDESQKRETEENSPLQGDAQKHEEEIVSLLKSIAHPLPGKSKLNRARTAQFLRAMMDLELIDPHLTGKHLMHWVEDVTEYKDGDAGHFQQAIKSTTSEDSNVVEFRKQLESIISK